jgi:3-deoxy-D-manno-octulosonic acid kinase
LRSNVPLVRTLVGGYTCHLACQLGDEELRRLIAELAAPAHVPAVSQNGSVLSGRAAIWRYDVRSVGPVVVKEYRRGGMLRFFRRKHYLRLGTTRPVRELNNLLVARAAGLNVPEPVASISRGGLVYRGWLATRFIQGRRLVDLVSSDTVSIPALMADLTRQVELLIRNRVAHVDLHPGNVIVDDAGTLYLLDFDRASVFVGSEDELRHHYEVRWQRAIEKHRLPSILTICLADGLHERTRRER